MPIPFGDEIKFEQKLELEVHLVVVRRMRRDGKVIQSSTDIPLAVKRSVPTDLPRSENEAQNPIDTTLPANDDALSPGETKTRRRPIDPRVARLFVALEAGEIPRELRETFKLVDPASPLGTQFQEAMLTMLESVAPGNSFRESGYRFILSCDDGMAMGAFAKAKPPIVVVGSTFLAKGFFKMEPNAELLYGCVIHERVHHHWKSRQVTKVEEMAADIKAIDALFERKLALDPFIGFFKAAHRHSRHGSIIGDMFQDAVRAMLDVHPLDATRVGYLEDRQTQLERERGAYSAEPTILKKDHPLRVLAGQAFYDSEVDKIIGGRKAFEKLTVGERAEALIRTVSQLSDPQPWHMRDLASYLTPRSLVTGQREATRLIGELADQVLDRVTTGLHQISALTGSEHQAERRSAKELNRGWQTVYHRIERSMMSRWDELVRGFSEGSSASVLPGRLARIARCAEQLLYANQKQPDLERIKGCMIALYDALQSEPLMSAPGGLKFLQSVPLPFPRWTVRVGRPVPWRTLTKVALTALTDENDARPALAMLRYGLEDPRMYPALSSDDLRSLIRDSTKGAGETDGYFRVAKDLFLEL